MLQVIFKIPTGLFWIPVGLTLALVFGIAAWQLKRRAPHRKVTLSWLKGLGGIGLFLAVAGPVLGHWVTKEIPIYGYGLMLFVAFIVCTWLAGHRAQQEGIPREHIQDLAIWLFIGGLLGARITFMLKGPTPPNGWDVASFLKQLPQLWDGGVILYGAVIGGLISYGPAYWFIVRKNQLSGWQIADIVAPSVALGIALGRIGCLLNGCCYGHVACPHCPSVSYPLSAPARFELVGKGFQTAAGFTLLLDADDRTVLSVNPNSPVGRSGLKRGDLLVMVDEEFIRSYHDFREYIEKIAGKQQDLVLTVRRDGKSVILPAFVAPKVPGDVLAAIQAFKLGDCVVGEVEPNSPAAREGLQKGDKIFRANDRNINQAGDLSELLSGHSWERGVAELRLTVVGADGQEKTLAFAPRTIGLHPTQLYETISMVLLFLVLTFYYPLRRNDGEVMGLLMAGYAVHRYLNEMLRSDLRPQEFEKWVSIIILGAGIVLFVWRRFWGR